MSPLPIIEVMPKLLSGITNSPQLILKAAPGAGKSTYFPLQLLQAGGFHGKIIMLEHGVWLRVTLPAIWRSNWGKRLGSV